MGLEIAQSLEIPNEAALRDDWSTTNGIMAQGQMLQAMRVNGDPLRTQGLLQRFASVFTKDASPIISEAGIDASSTFYDWDVRHVIGTQRTYAATVAPEENFDDITDWTTNVGVTVVNPGDPDPMVGMVAEMNTGLTAGSQSVLRKLFGTVPASFGVSVLMGMKTANAATEATEFQIQNNQGHQLRVRVYTGAIQAFYDGAWNTLFNYGGVTTALTEWWFEVKHNSGSNYTMRLFAGTQELPGFTGNLPSGTAGENGWVGFIQYSGGGNNHRKAHLAFLQVGSSALPPGINLVSTALAVQAPPRRVSLGLLLEDTCLGTVTNTDVQGWISDRVDGNGNPVWYQVVLAKLGEVASGVLDVTKPVYLLGGTVTLPAGGTSNIRSRVTSGNVRYFSLTGWAWAVIA